jgi:hypothetical protein
MTRNDRIAIAVTLTAAAVNLVWALAFPNAFTWLNWTAFGSCITLAAFQPTLARLHRLVEDQNTTIVTSNAAMDAVSPAHMQRMMRGALLQVVEQMRKDGTLPPDVAVDVNLDNLPQWPPSKSVH